MLLNYNAIDGQTLFDVVLNTYGSIDYIYKLINDNGIENINYEVKSGDVFVYDSELITDSTIYTNTTLSGVKFTTAWRVDSSLVSEVDPDFDEDFSEDFGNDYNI